jgi:hypothetical protein
VNKAIQCQVEKSEEGTSVGTDGENDVVLQLSTGTCQYCWMGRHQTPKNRTIMTTYPKQQYAAIYLTTVLIFVPTLSCQR